VPKLKLAAIIEIDTGLNITAEDIRRHFQEELYTAFAAADATVILKEVS
jgi:hypothetical protein